MDATFYMKQYVLVSTYSTFEFCIDSSRQQRVKWEMSVKAVNELGIDMGPFEVRLQQSGGGVLVWDAGS